MQQTVAHPSLATPSPGTYDLPKWKSIVSLTCAIIVAALFISAGGWKVTDPFGSAARLAQAKVPGFLSLPAAVGLGIVELFAAALILMPRFRRWGAWLNGLMLVAFMIWVGYFYNDLRGEECQCFPWLKRAVGPGFFIGDALMLLAAAIAGWWARPSYGLRPAAMILAAVAVFAGVSYGVAHMQNSGTKAPEFITVDGKKTSLGVGRVFLYFYDPECSHCDEAARRMSKHNWKDTKVIGIPTRVPQFAAEFMSSTGMKAGNSPEHQLLKGIFPFGDPPYGVALENGRQKAAMAIFDKDEPEATLRKLGFIE